MDENKLITRQEKVVQFYEDNATDAARKTGYEGSNNFWAQTGHDLLRNSKIASLIKERDNTKAVPLVTNREVRQMF